MGWGFPKGSKLRESFDFYLNKLAASGLILHWYELFSALNTQNKSKNQLFALALDQFQEI
jgi:hypothetical protein